MGQNWNKGGVYEAPIDPASPVGEVYYGGLIGPQHHDHLRRQMIWGLDYIDARYGTRWSRIRRHLAAAWREATR